MENFEGKQIDSDETKYDNAAYVILNAVEI